MNPNGFDYFNRSESFAYGAVASTTGFDYFNRGEVFGVMINASGGPVSGYGQGAMLLVGVG